ncbi:MAG: DUF1028 domain-containing protein [candidate division Zixibacteria bacterium]|nr:DUF1028 domain-containing protein [candidate division Zixibacteria bacterium]
MFKFTLTLLVLALPVFASAENKTQPVVPIRPVNTYSIVAYDSVTGQFGAAVQSHWFKVANVIWAEPNVGAVATQSLVDFAYGPLGIEMMKLGKTATQALDGLKASDPNYHVRQVAMIDNRGNVAAHTGDKCIAEAGHQIGHNYSVQANLMENPTVPAAMATAFENAKGDLAERLMVALEAAQAEGGDIRGMQSAAILVVTGQPTGQSWKDRLVDLRVDDDPEPLVELRRLLDINRAYELMNQGDDFIVEGKLDKAGQAYAKAAELSPGNMEIIFWHAVTLVTAGEVGRSLPLFKQCFEDNKGWRTLIPRLVTADILPDDKKVIDKIVGL